MEGTMTAAEIDFDMELVCRYDISGPRYTSYPTAASFHGDITQGDYHRHAMLSNELPVPRPISLYVHIPFCDTLCFYCGCNKIATKNRSLADEYLDHLQKEADMVSDLFDNDREVTQLHWGGGTPTFLTTEQTDRLMSILSSHWNLSTSADRDFSIEIDPRSVDAQGIEHLASLGFNRFSLGVQDIDQKVQEAVNRLQPTELTESIIKACRDVNARSINIDLIYGLPFQTADNFNRTLDQVIEWSPDRLSIFNYAHMPDMFPAQKRINEADLPEASQKLDMFAMTVERLTDAGYVYIGLDHFAKPDDELVKALNEGSLQRNFQGYTTHSDTDLVSLGVSAISSFYRLFTQNEKTLEAYYERIDSGELPIARGVELDMNDCIRRDAIQQIMCQNELDFDLLDKHFYCESESYFNEEVGQLAPLQDDGLLKIMERKISLTAKGRFLARIVAMVFDQASQQLATRQRFSKVI
jgi:oxygen-independent coproporphyrinogen-3 oxidase